MKVKVTQSCLTLCNPMDCTVHWILQIRVLEWVVFPFSRGSSQPRDWTQVSHITGRFFTLWATREAQVSYPKYISPFAWPPNPCAEASWNISVQLSVCYGDWQTHMHHSYDLQQKYHGFLQWEHWNATDKPYVWEVLKAKVNKIA